MLDRPFVWRNELLLY